ncbi:MAG: glycosyl hydrolase family 18 protein [Microgenomates group bacterium]
MRKFLGIFLTAAFFGGLFFYFILRQATFKPTFKSTKDLSKKTERETEKKRPKIEAKSQGLDTIQPLGFKAKTIFVPQWQINQLNQWESVEISPAQADQLNQYQRVIYFGSEENFELFNKMLRSQLNFKGEVWFTVKITQLPQEKSWLSEREKTVDIVKNYNLQGVALDLEINSLPTDDLVNQINNFVQDFRKELAIGNWKLGIILYGDTFFRKRPYDVGFLSKNSDEVMVMAYDFHKSYGEPGPNFPYEAKDKFGYDFKTMIDDFLKFVLPEKLTVIFGMYGYDWRVDEKKRPITQAKALTLKQIKEKFIMEASSNRAKKDDNIGCRLENCIIKRDEVSKEVEINYVISSKTPDDQGIYHLDYHIVWFEDEESVKIKTDFLKEKGVGSVAFWAWRYF